MEAKYQLYANINKKNWSKACIKDVSNLYCQILFFRPADATKYFLPKPQVYLFCERAYQITFNLLLVIAYVVIKNGSISLFRFIFIENKTLIHASLSPQFLISYSRNRNDRNHEGQFLQLKQHLIFPSLSVVVEYCMMRFITPNVLHLIHFIHEV